MKLRRIIQWTVGIFFLLLVFYLGDMRSLSSFPSVDWYLVIVLFVVSMFFVAVHNARWLDIVRGLMAAGQRSELRFFDFYQWLTNSYLMAMVIPADISLVGVRMFYMRRSNILLPRTALFSVLIDRCLDLLVFLVFFLPALLFFTGCIDTVQTVLCLAFISALIALFVAIKRDRSFNLFMTAYTLLIRMASRLPLIGSRFQTKKEIPETEETYTAGMIYSILGWSFLKYFMGAFRIYLLGAMFGAHFSFFQAMLVMSVIQLSFLLSVTPAGLGVIELGTYGALALIGVKESTMLPFIVGQRIIFSSITIILALGTNFIGYIRSGMEKRQAL